MNVLLIQVKNIKKNPHPFGCGFFFVERNKRNTHVHFLMLIPMTIPSWNFFSPHLKENNFIARNTVKNTYCSPTTGSRITIGVSLHVSAKKLNSGYTARIIARKFSGGT